MIQIYCGEGKGKTTAAIGGSIRAAGAGMQVLFTQFMKGNETSELSVLEKVSNIEILRSKKEFGFYGQMTEQDKKELTDIHNKILNRIEKFVQENQSQTTFIVLDELTYAYQWNLIHQERLIHFLKKSKENNEIVITGRKPEKEMVELADYISNIVCQKHPFERGIHARKGIEF